MSYYPSLASSLLSSLPLLPTFSYFAHPPSGQEPSDKVVDGMMSEAPGPLNFTMFLTLFGEKLTGRFYPGSAMRRL